MNTSPATVIAPTTHPFDKAGLGRPPYRFLGCYAARFQACQGAPVQAGASCDFCGTAIMQCFQLRSADGKEFKVGCDCIRKTAKKYRTFDAGIEAALKADRDAKRLRSVELSDARMAKAVEALQSTVAKLWWKEAHPNGFAGKTRLDWARWMWKHSGRAGKMVVVKAVEATLADIALGERDEDRAANYEAMDLAAAE